VTGYRRQMTALDLGDYLSGGRRRSDGGGVMSRLSYVWSLLPAASRNGETDDANKEALVARLLTDAPQGDVDAAIRVIDDFGRNTTWLMNVGDEKGPLLDDAVRRARPARLLELGAFCGYGGLRIASAMPEDARLYSGEMNPVNAGLSPPGCGGMPACADRRGAGRHPRRREDDRAAQKGVGSGLCGFRVRRSRPEPLPL